MDINKDYYAILGVLPTAEDVVIRAAYKALVQRYHPDRWEGDKGEATIGIREINEAWRILSDHEKRQKYDEMRGNGVQSSYEYFNGQEDDESGSDPLGEAWSTAIEYYPELVTLEHTLRKVSWRLAYTFKACMLELKLYEKREEIARDLKRQFMENHFGENEEILAFAELLISNGYKHAAKRLNEAVCILGSDFDPRRVIDKIEREEGVSESQIFKSKFGFEKKELNEADSNGLTKLMHAVIDNDEESVLELLRFGADPKIEYCGSSAMGLAQSKGVNIRIIKILKDVLI